MDLYISDLDGTLLNSDQKLSVNTIRIINELIEDGMNFTVATARSFTSAGPIIAPLKLKLPIIVHNGVFIYDAEKNTNVLENIIQGEIIAPIIEIFEKRKKSPFIFAHDAKEPKVYYKGIFNKGEEIYINSRLRSGDKRFTLIGDFKEVIIDKVINFLAIGSDEELRPIYEEIRSGYELVCHYGVDIYTKDYWLEVTNAKADKRGAIEILKDMVCADKLICFGDNLNDCPMFEISDERYAVLNANELLKKKATAVIGSNDEDGVALFLKERYKLDKEN